MVAGCGGAEPAGPAVDAGTEDSGTADDSGVADTGDPGTGDAGEASGACTNPADLAVHMNTDISAAIETCASGCFGGQTCTRSCIMNDVGLSADCTECYVQVTTCAIQNCLTSCAGTNSAACDQCRDDSGCTAAFEACSGVPSG